MIEEIHKIVIQGDESSARRAFRSIKTGADALKRDLNSVSRFTDDLSNSFRNLVRAGSALLGIGLGANLVRDTVRMADQWALVDARIRNATQGQEAYRQASGELLEIAKRTSSEYESVATLFTRTNQFIIANGGNQRDTLKLVELVAQAAKVSGTGVQEQQASVRQLSQALASGVLRGDEFNSVMENSPRLAQALADGLGVPIGALRGMAEQGELTADVVTRALLGQADKISAELSRIPLTVGAAFTNLKTATGEFVNDFDRANGVTRGLAESINELAKNLPALAETFKQLLLLGVPAYMIRLAASVDLAVVAFQKFLPALVALKSGEQVLKLLTAINEERLRQQDLRNNRAADRAQLVATEHLLQTQVQSLEQYKAMSAEAQKFYVKDLNEALNVAQLKLRLNAGTNEQLAEEGARQARIYRQALAEIAKADGDRAQAMKLHSNGVIAAKEMELARLQAVFKAQKQGLKEAEQAFEEARKRRADIVKEFGELKDEVNAAPKGHVQQFELEKAVEDALKAHEQAAIAPASEADRLANEAIDKARTAGELLKEFKQQQHESGSTIDAANADSVAKRLSDELLQIADAAAGVQEKIAADQVATMQKVIQDTLNQAEALKNITVAFDEAGAVQDMDQLLAAVRERVQNSPIQIPVQIVSGSLPEDLNAPQPTGVTDSQGRMIYRATGGPVFGPRGRDRVPAMLTHDEHVWTADEVKALGGHGAMYRLRRAVMSGMLPKFATGGAVSRAAIPSLPALSASGASGTTINLTLPGVGTFPVKAAPAVANDLQRGLRLEALKRGRRL